MSRHIPQLYLALPDTPNRFIAHDAYIVKVSSPTMSVFTSQMSDSC